MTRRTESLTTGGKTMSETTAGTCPAWCERDHADVQGVHHRAEVGHLDIRGKRLFVIVLATFDRPAAVMLTGAEPMIIEEDDTEDARGVFTLLGFPFLAQLTERAAFIVARHNVAWRLAQEVQD